MDTEELRQLEGIADNPRQIEEPEEAETSAKAGPQAWVIVCVGLLIAIGAYFVAKPLLAGSQKKPQKQETAVEQQQPSARERQLIAQENERKFKDIIQAQNQGQQKAADAITKADEAEQQGEADAQNQEQQKAPQTAVADNRVQQQQQPRTSRFRARPSRTIPQRRRTAPPVRLGRVEPKTERRPRPRPIPAVQPVTRATPPPQPVRPAVSPTVQSQEDFQTYIARMRNYASFSGKDNYTPPTGDDNSPTLTEVTNLETLGELQPLEELKPLELIGVGDGDDTPDHQAQAINIGQTFKAEIVSGVAWSTEAPIENQTVLAQLKDDMGSLPKGTFLSLAVTTASSNGLVSLTPQAAQLEGQSIPLPSLRITAPKGKPLIAKRKQSGGGFGLKDVLSPVLGAARSGATFINRTRSASTISTQGISQATTDNSQGSVIAALGGGFADQILQRAQQQTQAVQSQRTPYYLLPIGKTLEITVIQDVQI